MRFFEFQRIAGALCDRRGAVTVDWVVLTAGVVVLVIGLVTSMSGELSEIAVAMFAHAAGGVQAMQ
jgi:hypothetical protein